LEVLEILILAKPLCSLIGGIAIAMFSLEVIAYIFVISVGGGNVRSWFGEGGVFFEIGLIT
jgi:hypothetical protein